MSADAVNSPSHYTGSNIESIDVDYREAVADPREQAARVAAFLELDLDVDRMAGAVDPALYRNRG